MIFSKEVSVCAIILAAGESNRFGVGNKLLANLGGIGVLERVVSVLSQSSVQKIFVVTGKDHNAVASLLFQYEVELVRNENWQDGMGRSLAIGVGLVEEGTFNGILVCLGDLPYLTVHTIEKVLSVFREKGGGRIVVPEYRGLRGHPVVFPISFRSQLLELTGDQGAKEILKSAVPDLEVVEVFSPEIFKDIDSRADLESGLK